LNSNKNSKISNQIIEILKQLELGFSPSHTLASNQRRKEEIVVGGCWWSVVRWRRGGGGERR